MATVTIPGRRRGAHEALFYQKLPVETLRRARRIGLSAGLRYVYEGNVPGEGGEHTWCRQCGARLIERYGHRVLRSRLRDGGCPDCGMTIDGIGMGAGS